MVMGRRQMGEKPSVTHDRPPIRATRRAETNRLRLLTFIMIIKDLDIDRRYHQLRIEAEVKDQWLHEDSHPSFTMSVTMVDTDR